MIVTISENAKAIIRLLLDNGFDAYAVGGCVRDSLMKREVGDVDIASSAAPYELEKLLSENGIKYVETGIKHGTVTAVIHHEPFEITTFRSDGDYADNRHPNSVEFIRDIDTDLARRDFTMNAIAYNEERGIVDLYGGQQDIDNRLIRAVGNADRRFKEDALRIMRALRFASVLGFDIEESTKKAIFDNKELLKYIAVERLLTELKKLILGNNVEKVLLEYRDVIAVIIPELMPCFDYPQNTKWHIYDVYTHIVKSVALCPKKDYIRLAMLFHDIGKPYTRTVDSKGADHFKGHPVKSAEIASQILKRFKVSNDLYYKVIKLIEVHDFYIRLNKPNIKHWLNDLGEELTFDYIDVKIADLSSHNLDLSKEEIDTLYLIKRLTEEIIENAEPYKISDLKINGSIIQSLGYSGKQIAAVLDYLLEEVIQDPSKNNEGSLIRLAKEKR